MGGTEVESATVKAGGKLTKPIDPIKDGDIFDGWYISDTDFSSDNRWSFIGYTVTENMTLYAKYTPEIISQALALMIVIDCSDSMNTIDDETSMTRLEIAKQAAKECLNALSDRDYVGIISFNQSSKVVIPLTSITQKDKILQAIDTISAAGQTIYTNTIQYAGGILQEVPNADRRHVIFFSDGEPVDSSDVYEFLVNNYSMTGITWSFVALVYDATLETIGQQFANLGCGNYYLLLTIENFAMLMREELAMPY